MPERAPVFGLRYKNPTRNNHLRCTRAAEKPNGARAAPSTPTNQRGRRWFEHRPPLDASGTNHPTSCGCRGARRRLAARSIRDLPARNTLVPAHPSTRKPEPEGTRQPHPSLDHVLKVVRVFYVTHTMRGPAVLAVTPGLPAYPLCPLDASTLTFVRRSSNATAPRRLEKLQYQQDQQDHHHDRHHQAQSSSAHVPSPPHRSLPPPCKTYYMTQ